MTNQPFFVPAVIILVASIPLILGFIPKNRVYGIRTLKTMSNDDIWYKANRFGGWAFFLSGVIYLAAAMVHPTQGPRDADFTLWLMHLCVLVVPLIASALLTHVYSKRL